MTPNDTGGLVIDLSRLPRRYGGFAASPFRYPGGKGFLTSFLSEQLKMRFGENRPAYAEPYCGGAGSAVNLLTDGEVDRLYLNDADHRIYSAWRGMVEETDRFVDLLQSTSVTVETWESCLQKVYERRRQEYDFDVGFAAFFVNRTSRSGVLMGSGPIGGYDQTGRWKIDARFNKDALTERIQKIGKLKDCIALRCMDGLEFCKDLVRNGEIESTLLFIDPPYVHAGGRLYLNDMTLAKHDELAEWLLSATSPHWILTYDDHPIVRENFQRLPLHRIQVQYSLGKKRIEKELLYMS